MPGPHGTIVWSELMTRQPEAARAYYGALCGWQWHRLAAAGEESYFATSGGNPVAAVSDLARLPGGDGPEAGWLTYIAVADVDAAAAATDERGGRVIRPPSDVPGLGRIAILEDPAGGIVGMMTPAVKAAKAA